MIGHSLGRMGGTKAPYVDGANCSHVVRYKIRNISIRPVPFRLLHPFLWNMLPLLVEPASTMWRRLLYSGFHTPKAVTYHDL